MGVCGAVLARRRSSSARGGAGCRSESPPPIDAPSTAEVARRYAWYCALLLAAGITSGITVVGDRRSASPCGCWR